MNDLKALLTEAGFHVRVVPETLLPFQGLTALVINDNLKFVYEANQLCKLLTKLKSSQKGISFRFA